VARQLAQEGHQVRSRAERPGQGATSDLLVCGEAVEIKAFLPLSERAGSPMARSVCNKLLDAARQAPSAVLLARESGLDEMTARRGVRLFAARGGFERLSVVRVLGDRFDLSWGSPGRPVGPEVSRGRPVGPEVSRGRPVGPEVSRGRPVGPEVSRGRPVRPQVLPGRPVGPEVALGRGLD
jgi:hypothetical protein